MLKKSPWKFVFGTLILAASFFSNAEIIAENEVISAFSGNTNASISYTGLAAHDSITINFDLFAYDSLDGNSTGVGPDIFGFRVDGIEVFSATFSNFAPLSNETNTVAATTTDNFNSINSWGPIDRYFDNYNGGFTLAHTGSTLNLTFFSSGLQSLSDESFSLSDIDVTSNIVNTPEPSLLALMGLGLLSIGFRKTRSGRQLGLI